MRSIKGVQRLKYKLSSESPKVVFPLNDVIIQVEGRLQAQQVQQEKRLYAQQQEIKADMQAKQEALEKRLYAHQQDNKADMQAYMKTIKDDREVLEKRLYAQQQEIKADMQAKQEALEKRLYANQQEIKADMQAKQEALQKTFDSHFNNLSYSLYKIVFLVTTCIFSVLSVVENYGFYLHLPWNPRDASGKIN